MRPFDGKRVLLGVSGGIAAYKSAELVRLLVKAGADVDVILTAGGSRFVGSTTFEGLTGWPVYSSLWDKPMAHLELGRSADSIVVAPATAGVLSRLAAGGTDDLLSATLLAAPRRAILAPAMNHRMYEHPATQRNLRLLGDDGHVIVGPAHGELAEREVGWGRMAEPELLFAYIGRDLEPESRWTGRRVVVTAGPTREAVDPVRFIGNRSSGRMGYAIAAAAWQRGAEVILVTGPTEVPVPAAINDVRRVETAEQMCSELHSALDGAAALFMVAAVSDFRPAAPETRKIRRNDGLEGIAVEPVADLLASVTRDGCVKIAFAAEVGEGGVEAARRKLRDKGAEMIVLNDPSEPGAGFEVNTNRVTILDSSGVVEELPLAAKTEVADEILIRAERLLPGD